MDTQKRWDNYMYRNKKKPLSDMQWWMGVIAGVTLFLISIMAIGAWITSVDCRDTNNPSKYEARLAHTAGISWKCEVKVTGKWINKSATGEKDYRYADLRGDDWSNRDLIRNGFRETVLRNSNFNRTNLTEAKMQGADMRGASFVGANLTGTDLSDANLAGADFTNANLTGANLTRTNRTEAIFAGAILTGVTYGDEPYQPVDYYRCGILGGEHNFLFWPQCEDSE